MTTTRALALSIVAVLCRQFEGFVGTPYLCDAGVPTIGYGATHYLDGRRVTLKDPPISREAAERLLLMTLDKQYLPQVLTLCLGLANETPERLAAIIDFTFNLGAGSLKASTLRKRINSGDWADVPAQLLRWNKAGGRVLRGLTRRREAEANLVQS